MKIEITKTEMITITLIVVVVAITVNADWIRFVLGMTHTYTG